MMLDVVENTAKMNTDCSIVHHISEIIFLQVFLNIENTIGTGIVDMKACKHNFKHLAAEILLHM